MDKALELLDRISCEHLQSLYEQEVRRRLDVLYGTHLQYEYLFGLGLIRYTKEYQAGFKQFIESL